MREREELSIIKPLIDCLYTTTFSLCFSQSKWTEEAGGKVSVKVSTGHLMNVYKNTLIFLGLNISLV